MGVAHHLFVFALVCACVGLVLSAAEAGRQDRGRRRQPWWRSQPRVRARDREPHGQRGRPRSASRFGWRLRGPSPFDSLFGKGLKSHVSFTDPDIDFSAHFGWDFGDEEQNWWEGPNVCKEEKTEEKNLTLSALGVPSVSHTMKCEDSWQLYKCVYKSQRMNSIKERTVTYSCCHGYQREKGKPGCTRELVLKPLVETLRSLNSTSQFLKALDSVRLTPTLTQSNYTIFAPSNDAFKKFLPKEKMRSAVVEVDRDAMNEMTRMMNLLAGHVVEGFQPASHWSNDQILQTENPSANIRIWRYRDVKTANCVPITSEEKLSTNGAVHVIARVLRPVDGSTLFDLVSRHPQLTVMKKVLGRSELSALLKKEGSYTLLAPTDGAFAKLSTALSNTIMSGDDCAKNVLKYHVLPVTACTAAFSSLGALPNIMSDAINNIVNLTRSHDGKYFADGAQVVVADVMAANGVMHIIDDVIIPDEALGPSHMADRLGASEFINYVKSAGLQKTIDNLQNVTIFVPTNEAFQNLPSSLKERLEKNPGELAKLLKYHVSTAVQPYRTRPWTPLPTLHSNKKIHFHQMSPTAECSAVVKYDVRMCNGIIHVIDKVMTPPSGNLLDTLAQHNHFSRLIGLLKKAGLADTLQEGGPYTLIALTNKAIEKMDRDRYRHLVADAGRLKRFLQQHLIQNFQCCSAIGRGWIWSDLTPLITSWNRRGSVTINNVPVMQCDITATNGVIHAVDSPIIYHSARLPTWEPRWSLGRIHSLADLFDRIFPERIDWNIK